jgi:exodeoxyribonuclease-1
MQVFGDEFTRHTLYRNFMSLKWVHNEEGKPIFKLDQLAPANGIKHNDAHDALADVRATIAIAKIIKQTQPRLFDYAFSLREKRTVERKIKPFEPMLNLFLAHNTDAPHLKYPNGCCHFSNAKQCL